MLIDRLSNANSTSAGQVRSDRLNLDERRPPRTGPVNHNVVRPDFNQESTEELVFLYQNFDTEAQEFVSNTNNRLHDRNQLVETVVYDNDSDASYASESFSLEDLHDLLLFNEEQFKIFECGRSKENQLCHKYSELAIHLSNLSMSNDRQCSFKYPCNKKRFESLRSSPYFNSFRGANRHTPMDSIRKECFVDNYYNAHMENVIKFVNNTIDQLKKISDGEYLSPKAKAKWCKVDGQNSCPETDASTTSASLPLHIEIESQPETQLSKWEELVHSEIDIGSLTRMLEQRIVVEMPRMMYDSVGLLDKCEITLPCESKDRERAFPLTNSHLDLLHQFERSGSASVVNEFSSILLLQTKNLPNENVIIKKLLPIAFEEDILNESTIGKELVSYIEESTDEVVAVDAPVPTDREHKALSAILYKSPAKTFEEKMCNGTIPINISISQKMYLKGIITISKSNAATDTQLIVRLKDCSEGRDTNQSLQSITFEESTRITTKTKFLKVTEESDQNGVPSTDEKMNVPLEDGEDALPSSSLSVSEKEPSRNRTALENNVEGDQPNSNDSTTVRDAIPLGVSRSLSEYDDNVSAELFTSVVSDSSNSQPDYLRGTLSPIDENSKNDNVRQMGLKSYNDMKNDNSSCDGPIFLMEEKRKESPVKNRACPELTKIVSDESNKSMKDEVVKVTGPQTSRYITELPVNDKFFYSSVYRSTKNDVEQKNEGMVYERVEEDIYPRQPLEGDVRDKIVDDFFENCDLKPNLDAALSEMTYVKINKENSTDVSGKSLVCSSSTTSTSVLSGSHMNDNLHTLPPLSESPRENGINDREEFHSLFKSLKDYDEKESSGVNGAMMPTNIFHFVHDETPKGNCASDARSRAAKRALPQECRKSIDKIYDLMKEMVNDKAKTKVSADDNRETDMEMRSLDNCYRGTRMSRAFDADELATSKFSLKKLNHGKNNKKNNICISIVPKHNANTKSSTRGLDVDEKRKFSFKEQRSNESNAENHENSFRAVSRALRALDDNGQNVKRRHVAAELGAKNDIRYNKCTDVGIDRRWASTRCSRAEQRGRGRELYYCRNESNSPRKKCLKLSQIENPKVPTGGDNSVHNSIKKNIADVIDEAKEARGEAVRGPPKQNATRLDALAQPRRPYVQAHSEYYRRRHGRTLVADRLQRLAAPAHTSPLRSYAYVDTPCKESKKLINGKPVKQRLERARIRSNSAESQSPARSPSTRVGLPRKRRSPTQLASRHPDVEMTEFDSSIKGQRLIQKECPKVRFEKAKCMPLQGISSDDSFEIEQKSLMEEPSAVHETLNIDSASNHSLLKIFKNSTDESYALCAECKVESKTVDTKIETRTHSTENDILSIEPTELGGLSNTISTDNAEANVMTDLSIDSRSLEDKFNVHLNLIREFSKRVQNTSDQVFLTNGGIRDRALCDAFEKIVKFNEEPENCLNSLNQIVIVKSENPVHCINPELESRSFSVLDVLPMILKTHLDIKLPDVPIQIATVGYALSQCSNVERNSNNRNKCHNERVKEIRSAEDMIWKIRNDRPDASILNFKSSLSIFRNDENGSVSDSEMKLTKSYTICNQNRETNESEMTSIKKDDDAGCQEKILTKIFSNNDSRFSDRHDNRNDTWTADEADGNPGDGSNCSSSLDILAGLLNEIKKISKCQAYIATNYNRDSEIFDELHNDSHSPETRNSSYTRSDTKYSLTISGAMSHDRKCSESLKNELTSCLNSTKMSNNRSNNLVDGILLDSKCLSCDVIGRTKYDEKGINVDICENGRVSAYTEPERPFPERAAEAAGVCSGRLGASDLSSSSSAFSLKESHLNKTAIGHHRNVVELNVSDESYNDTVTIYKKVGTAGNNDYVDLVETMKISEKPVTRVENSDRENASSDSDPFYVDNGHDSDPLLKLKRDILLTMYSVFVFLVFVVLSFSQIVYT